MVRTLVFHSNNVGSIPTSLNISINGSKLTLLNHMSSKHDLSISSNLRYEFRFVSLISPGWASQTDSYDRNFTHSDTKFKRSLLKRSYLILSWFYYLDVKGFNSHKSAKQVPSIKLAILPASKKMYTLTKAPMAHKTNSKEQFLFKFYNFKFSVNLNTSSAIIPMSVSQGAYTLNLAYRFFPVFETNMLFLKYYRIHYPIRATAFFQHLLN